jgi:hypothetical protein
MNLFDEGAEMNARLGEGNCSNHREVN